MYEVLLDDGFVKVSKLKKLDGTMNTEQVGGTGDAGDQARTDGW